MLPVCLIVKGRDCLIVGGGNVAVRKAIALVEAGALITIIAPELSERIRELASIPTVTVKQKEYMSSDLHGNLFLVIAATDNHFLNRQILEDCRKFKILAASHDDSWVESDFISPATFVDGDVMVSISTAGRSCRKSKLIKDNLSRYIQAVEKSEVIVIGTDHRYSTIELREKIYLTSSATEYIASMLKQIVGVHEFMLLCTCNRVEFIGVACIETPIIEVIINLMGMKGLDEHYYVYKGKEAFKHLTFLTAGLRSQLIGETHICSQLKDALEMSQRYKWSGALLWDICGRAFRIGREVRESVTKYFKPIEIEDVSVAFLESLVGSLRNKRVLVIGSGVIGIGIIERLVARDAIVTCLYHSRLPEFSSEITSSIEIHHLNMLKPSFIAEYDAVILALRGTKPILTRMMRPTLKSYQKLYVFDLGVPRNVDATFVGDSERIKVINLEDIPGYMGKYKQFEEAFNIAEQIFNKYVNEYDRFICKVQGGESK